MTATPTLLGPGYDAPAMLSDSLFGYEVKRTLALGLLNRAESEGRDDVVRTMFWELGMIDLNVTTDGDPSPYGGGSFEAFAAHYRMSDETVKYARERAAETQDVVLRIHYLTFVLLRCEPRGRAWVDLQRELATALREYIDRCWEGATNDPNGHAGVHIDRALVPLRRLLARPGVLRGSESADYSEWMTCLAEGSRDFPEPDARRRELQRHRWIADYLLPLTSLPPEASSDDVRSRALQLLTDATLYYESEPLNDDFERAVAETDAALRKHWGEAGTHEKQVRQAVASFRRRAEFHRATGNGMLTAHFFREARSIVDQHRQYFTDADVADLQRAEQQAHAHSVAAGEYARIEVPLSIPKEEMDLTKETPAATVDAMVAFALQAVPNWDELRRQSAELHADAPLQAIIPRTVVSQDKVVGEANTPAQNCELDVERHAMLLARINGAVLGVTTINAARAIGLAAADLLVPLNALELDAGTRELIAVGVERLIAEDFVSAVHVLVPRFEDCLRQHLRAIGVDTTRFNPDVGDGTSRTDDAPLGALLRASLPDGRTVREYLGDDLWNHADSTLNSQTGLNLRNDVAHGLARPGTCTIETAGLMVGLLYQLASASR